MFGRKKKIFFMIVKLKVLGFSLIGMILFIFYHQAITVGKGHGLCYLGLAHDLP
jgi:hypothetical protein